MYVFIDMRSCSWGQQWLIRGNFIVLCWFLENGPLLNAAYTEAVVFGAKTRCHKITTAGDTDILHPALPMDLQLNHKSIARHQASRSECTVLEAVSVDRWCSSAGSSEER